MLHLDIQTPLRNGRKRVLRKSVSATTSSPSSCDSPKSSERISHLRKQQRLDAKPVTRRRSSVTMAAPAEKATSASKSTASPTDSSCSSIKENTAPATAVPVPVSVSVPPPAAAPTAASKSNHKSPQASRRRSASHLNSSTPVSRILTRHSARKLRMNTMCMTRKRVSQELSMTEDQLKVSTPKRVRQDKAAHKKRNTTERSPVHTNSSKRSTLRTRLSGAEAPIASRTRHK